MDKKYWLDLCDNLAEGVAAVKNAVAALPDGISDDEAYDKLSLLTTTLSDTVGEFQFFPELPIPDDDPIPLDEEEEEGDGEGLDDSDEE